MLDHRYSLLFYGLPEDPVGRTYTLGVKKNIVDKI